jgi:hypothetical protein
MSLPRQQQQQRLMTINKPTWLLFLELLAMARIHQHGKPAPAVAHNDWHQLQMQHHYPEAPGIMYVDAAAAQLYCPVCFQPILHGICLVVMRHC